MSNPPPNDAPPATPPPGDTPPAAPATPPAVPGAPIDGAPPATPPVAPAAPAAPEGALLAPPGTTPATPPVTSLLETFAEKHRVLAADGSLDVEASARKQAEAYKALETRMGAGDVRPETADGYKLEPTIEGMDPEEFKAWTADPLWQGFQQRAHAKGFTNEQMQFLANDYLETQPAILEAQVVLGATEARTELAKLWTDPAVLDSNLASVHKAVSGFGRAADPELPGSQQRLYNKFANDPDFIAFAAQIAREMPEDPGAGNGLTPTTQGDVDSIMRGDAYRNANHPDHAQTKARVQAFFDQQYGTAPKR